MASDPTISRLVDAPAQDPVRAIDAIRAVRAGARLNALFEISSGWGTTAASTTAGCSMSTLSSSNGDTL